ncbi:hypothetical protein [Mycobacteroides abscessus]|uniref:hypothetical protein n=1 Tax=Mycobacteroides abscessus TaxID=36809 RepID=UPI000C25969F|nr:hypothetical protein [Mycobacteroides abscessus]
MSEEISPDDANLTPTQVADRVEMLAHRSRASQDGALAQMEAALPGWMGQSQAALKDLIARLKEQDDQLHARAMCAAQAVREVRP